MNIGSLTVASMILIICFKVYANEHSPVFKVGYDYQAPHRFTDSNGNAVGTDIERVKKIFDKIDINLEFYEFPWKRILFLVEVGKLDMALSAANISQRQKYALFSDEVFKFGTNHLFIRNDLKEKYSKLESLSDLISSDLTIAIRQGASYSDEYELLIKDDNFKNRLLSIRTIDQAIKLAQKGRIDGVITNEEMLKWELISNCMDNPFYKAYDLSKKENLAAYLMFSKKTVSQSQVDSINEAMKIVNPSKLTFDISTYNFNTKC